MEVRTPTLLVAIHSPVNQWTYRKKILAPPCLGEALMREILVNISIFMVRV
jgi:hypothetical protein